MIRFEYDVSFCSIEMMNCCHGGCDNCDFSHIFDEKNAARVKWVPCYEYRKLIDGRDHTSLWTNVLECENNHNTINFDVFKKNVLSLRSQMSMGVPPSFSTTDNLNESTIAAFWEEIIHHKGDNEDIGSFQQHISKEEVNSNFSLL